MKKLGSLIAFATFASCSSAPSMRTPSQLPVSLESVKEDAFKRCQGAFVKPKTLPVPALDPPVNSGYGTEGMIYQEELMVRARRNLLDRDGFYFNPRPRAAVNTLPMDIFVDDNNDGLYRKTTWEDADFDYSHGGIQPPIDREKIPDHARVMTEIIIGHLAPEGGYPQLFDIRSSAYVRFAGYPPQITGASMRLGAHGIFQNGEDFPIVRSVYASIKDSTTAHAYLVVENELFCAAIGMDMVEGRDAYIVADNYFYMRKNFNWESDPHTALVAYSSMLWKTEVDTPERTNDEAHDSDTLHVYFQKGAPKTIKLRTPDEKLRVQEFPKNADALEPREWILANEDRNPAHYAEFAPALGDTNYDKRVSYKVQILESNVRHSVALYESNPDGEYGDNIVAASMLRQDVPKAKSVRDFVHFKYKTTAFYPEAK